MIKILSTLLALVILATGCENRSKTPEKNLDKESRGKRLKRPSKIS